MLNMELDLQSLYLGSMSRDVHSFSHWLRPGIGNPLKDNPPAFGLVYCIRRRYWSVNIYDISL